VARQEAPLRQLAHEVPSAEILALDATDENAPSKVFKILKPDILILGGGVFPPAAPIHEPTWQQFSANREVDVKIAFNFCKAALSCPLLAGASVVLLSSGAALAGSPLSGGYAGAKRTQIFIVPDTELGKHAIAGYSKPITTSSFLRSPTAS
jgi:NADP-dependent 3-hydroxy acid dehydrogenase YdfG